MEKKIINTTTLAAEGAQAAIAAAREKAESLGVAVNIAVVDRSGVLLGFHRMDGAAILSIQLAQDKAYTVTAFGMPTDQWYPMLENNPALLHGIVKADRLMIFGGGKPVVYNNEIIGAVGVSGGTAEEDEMVAAAGAQAAI